MAYYKVTWARPRMWKRKMRMKDRSRAKRRKDEFAARRRDMEIESKTGAFTVPGGLSREILM